MHSHLVYLNVKNHAKQNISWPPVQPVRRHPLLRVSRKHIIFIVSMGVQPTTIPSQSHAVLALFTQGCTDKGTQHVSV